jgi:hypothetical protein
MRIREKISLRHFAAGDSTTRTTMAPPLRNRWWALVVVASLVGCGGHGAGVTDAGRDGASKEVEVMLVASDAVPADAASESGTGDTPGEASGEASAEAPAEAPAGAGTPDALEDVALAIDAGSDAAPDVADAPASEVARDATHHEVAPPHDTRPKYLGSYAPATEGSTFPAVAPDGSTYLAGWFDQPTDFDPGPGQDVRMPLGHSDAFVTKLGPDGAYLWTVTFGGAGSLTQATAVSLSDTSLVVVGGYTNEVDFDPGPGVQNRLEGSIVAPSGFVLRLTTAAGAFVWVSTFTGTASCAATGVALDDDGSVYATGDFTSFCDLDPGDGEDERTASGQNGYLVKLGAEDGHEVWAKSFEGNACAAGLASVTTSSDGLVWATGQLDDACSLGGQAAPAGTGGGAVAIAAFTPDGTPSGLWSIPGGAGASIAGSPDGFVYVGGSITGVSSTDFDPGPGMATRTVSPGPNDPTGFVLQLGPGAAFQWVQTTSRISTSALAATDDGGVLVLGQPFADSMQTTAFTLTKRDHGGTSPWGLMLPGNSSAGIGIAAGPSTFVVTGSTSGSTDLDPGPSVDEVAADVGFASRYSF